MKKIITLFVLLICCQMAFSQQKVGAQAPPIENLKILNQTIPDLAGKYICLDFWATWCGPCIQSFPTTNKLAESYKDKVVFLAVSKEREATVQAFLKKNKYDNIYWAIDEQLKLHVDFSVKEIPVYYLISPENIIVSTGNSHNLSEELFDKIIQTNDDAKPEPKITISQEASGGSTIEVKETDNPERFLQQSENALFVRDSLFLFFPYLDGIELANRIKWQNIPKVMVELKIVMKGKNISPSVQKIANDLLKETYSVNQKEIEETRLVYQMKVNDKKDLDAKNTIVNEGVRQSLNQANDSVFLFDNYTTSEFCKQLEMFFFPKIIYPDLTLSEEYDWTLTLINSAKDGVVQFDDFRQQIKQKYNIEFIEEKRLEKIKIYYTED